MDTEIERERVQERKRDEGTKKGERGGIRDRQRQSERERSREGWAWRERGGKTRIEGGRGRDDRETGIET